MNVLIISSASINIDNYYVDLAKKISVFLAHESCDLVFGSSNVSMMGVCYQEFIQRGRKVYAYTNEKYVDGLKNIKEATSVVVKTTFDLKKVMYEKSDVIVCLAGGIGTISELLSFIEEKRSSNKQVPIIIYDENEFYEHLITQFKKMKDEKFVNECVINSFEVVQNLEQFEKVFNKLKESVIK